MVKQCVSPDHERRSTTEKEESMKARNIMVASIARTLLSLLCASLVVLSLSGCADTEEYYAETHSTPESRYNTHYGPDYYMYPWYGYYGGAYNYPY